MTSHGWFDVREIGPGVTRIGEPGHEEDVKSYLIEGDRDVAVLDTGMGVGDFRSLVSTLSDRNPIVLQTHAHWDHRGASAGFHRVLIHPDEADELASDMPNYEYRPWFAEDRLRDVPLPAAFDLSSAMIRRVRPTGYLHHGDRIDLGGRTLEIFHTPGHSPGGITVLDRTSRLLFPADVVNLGPVYLSDSDADLAAYRQSVDLLASLANEVDRVYPSHYSVPMSPSDVAATRDAFEEILAGREPDEQVQGCDVFTFSRFAFWVAPGAIAALRENGVESREISPG